MFHSSLDGDGGLSDDGDASIQYKSVGAVDLFQIRHGCSSSYAPLAFHAKDSRFLSEYERILDSDAEWREDH